MERERASSKDKTTLGHVTVREFWHSVVPLTSLTESSINLGAVPGQLGSYPQLVLVSVCGAIPTLIVISPGRGKKDVDIYIVLLMYGISLLCVCVYIYTVYANRKCVSLFLPFLQLKKKNVNFVIGFAYVNHYENGVNYTSCYRKLAQFPHGTIRIELSLIIFERSSI